MELKRLEKRKKKLELIKKAALPPEFIGNDDYEFLIIGWGSNYYLIKEALENLNRDNVAFLHFKQVYPLHSCVNDYVKKAKKIIAIENNPTGQFAKLVELETHIKINMTILNYSGYVFSVEELYKKLKKIVEGDKDK